MASSGEIEATLCATLARIRLSRNITQARLARDAGVSPRTITRFEQGDGTSLDTFIRVATALDLSQHLQSLFPDPTIRPIERAKSKGKERQRASQPRKERGLRTWTWGPDGQTKAEGPES